MDLQPHHYPILRQYIQEQPDLATITTITEEGREELARRLNGAAPTGTVWMTYVSKYFVYNDPLWQWAALKSVPAGGWRIWEELTGRGGFDASLPNNRVAYAQAFSGFPALIQVVDRVSRRPCSRVESLYAIRDSDVWTLQYEGPITGDDIAKVFGVA